jgi:uncharacterized integral membrane protein
MIRKLFLVVFVLMLGVFGLTFALKNPHSVTVSYYFNLVWEGPLVLLLLGVLAIGVVVGLIPGVFRVTSLRRQFRKAQRKTGDGTTGTGLVIGRES